MNDIDVAVAMDVGSLLRFLVLVVVFAIVFTTAQVAIARRYGSTATWVACAGTALAIVGWWLGTMAGTWPELLRPFAGALYMTIMATTVPLVASTWAIARSVLRHPARTTGNHFVRGALAFVIGLVLGLVLAIIPDVVRFLHAPRAGSG